MRFSSAVVAALCLSSACANKPPPEDPKAHRERGPMKIGVHHAIRISSALDKTHIHPMISEDGKQMEFALQHGGARYISPHFALLYLPSGCKLTVSDFDGDQTTEYLSGDPDILDPFWGHHVLGDSMMFSFYCEALDEPIMFDVDGYASGDPELLDSQLSEEDRFLREMELGINPFIHNRGLSLCGTDDRDNAVCHEGSTMYNKSRAVARLFINGSGACTGWLVGINLLMTNEHCITSDSDVKNTDFEFMGEEDECHHTSGNCWMCDRGERYDGDSLLVDNAYLDFALVKLKGNPGLKYGYLDLGFSEPVSADDVIYVPQHPGGRAKEIAVKDTYTGGNCKVKSISNGACSSSTYNDIRYSCDTEGGSSGSPVLDRNTHEVVALHHCGGGCNGNMGVPIFYVYDHVQPYVDPQAGTCAPGLTKLSVLFQTDKYGVETSYALVNMDTGKAVAGSTAFNGSTTYNVVRCIPDGNYKFTVYDSYGDGMCCVYGSGYYEIHKDGSRIKRGGDFDGSETTYFECSGDTDSPTQLPTYTPTSFPSTEPSSQPTSEPSDVPSSSPSEPSDSPTEFPTPLASNAPSLAPSEPSDSPTMAPTKTPSSVPTRGPTAHPSNVPTITPSSVPTGAPTSAPSASPTFITAMPTEGQCKNSASWKRILNGRTRRCSWIARNPNSRCTLTGEDRTRAYEGCAEACRCDSNCKDKSGWRVKVGGKWKRCSYIARNPKARCGKRGKDGTLALQGCAATCSCSAF